MHDPITRSHASRAASTDSSSTASRVQASAPTARMTSYAGEFESSHSDSQVSSKHLLAAVVRGSATVPRTAFHATSNPCSNAHRVAGRAKRDTTGDRLATYIHAIATRCDLLSVWMSAKISSICSDPPTPDLPDHAVRSLGDRICSGGCPQWAATGPTADRKAGRRWSRGGGPRRAISRRVDVFWVVGVGTVAGFVVFWRGPRRPHYSGESCVTI